ncbi:unnamed protein product [Moneuplotes crassus]|uniref:HMG box domain-containing protein n=1 Tax=Euplotes crassus TaxID=5936 RepID=A0AAD1XFA3_EUPCR|nr:unnamed protein product [Moneuplotes crassus]
MEASNQTQKEMAEIFGDIARSFSRLAQLMGADTGEVPSLIKSKGKSSKASKADKDKQDKSAKNKKQKKSKADKDPNAPKKPLTAFMLYTNKRRSEVMKANPGMKITEISTIIGKEWKELTEEEKNIWKEKHNDAKLIYELNAFNYKKSKTDAANNEVSAKHKKDEHGAAQESTMKTLAGKKRKKYSDDGSSIDSSSDEEPQKNKRHKAKKSEQLQEGQEGQEDRASAIIVQ